MTAQPDVAILMGSDSDWPVMQKSTEILAQFDIAFEVKITSAHRTPQQTHEYVVDAEKRGVKIFIAAAGLAAHLAGAVSAITVRPVIGVPIESGGLGGMDALLSTVQMPAGIPVATVAIGSAGSKNAAHLAIQMLALSDERLKQRIWNMRLENQQEIQRKDEKIQGQLFKEG